MNKNINNFEQFLNENTVDENNMLADGYEKLQSYIPFETQFKKGEIWFNSTGDYKQIYCVKRNNGFIGEVESMWTLFYKSTYFSVVRDKKNELNIENNGFKNIIELFDWLNPILIEHNKTFEWNFFAK